MLAGPDVTAVADDPEGAEVLAEVESAWRELPRAARRRVHLALLPMDDPDENAVIVNALQRRADVVVQKSVAEGFGLTVAEAMWKGRPVVASAVGGIQDQIEDGITGRLVDPHDLAAFGERVSALLADPHAAERMGAAARDRVRDCSSAPAAASAGTRSCSSASSPNGPRSPYSGIAPHRSLLCPPRSSPRTTPSARTAPPSTRTRRRRADGGGVTAVSVCLSPFGGGWADPYVAVDTDIEDTIAAALLRLRDEFPVATRTVTDASVARALHTVAREAEAGMIVVGSTDRGPAGRVLPGSTAERLLHGSPCPVALAPHGYTRAPVGTIAVGFVDSSEGHTALAVAHASAERAGASCA